MSYCQCCLPLLCPLAAPVIDLGPVAAAVASAIEIAAAAAAAASGGCGCGGGGGMAAAAALVMDATAAAAVATAAAIATTATAPAATAAAALLPPPQPRLLFRLSLLLLPPLLLPLLLLRRADVTVALKSISNLVRFRARAATQAQWGEKCRSSTDEQDRGNGSGAATRELWSLPSYCRLREDDFATVKPNLAPQSIPIRRQSRHQQEQ